MKYGLLCLVLVCGLSTAAVAAQAPKPPKLKRLKQKHVDRYEVVASQGRAHFYTAPYRPVAEPINAQFPLHLNTGRLRDQWHGMSRTGLVSRLYAHVEEPLLSMNRWAKAPLHPPAGRTMEPLMCVSGTT